MTGNTFADRVSDAGVAHGQLGLALFAAGRDAGHGEIAVLEAIGWAAIQLDPEADDYETWETTVLARLEDADKTGER